MTHLSSVVLVPAGADHGGLQGVFVVVAEGLHHGGGGLDEWELAQLEAVHVQVIGDVLGDGLRVGSAATAAHVDALVDWGELVRDSVGDVVSL